MAEEPPTVSTIKHLVISGGGINGFVFYGVLKETCHQNIWNMNYIKTIYCTSIGSVLAVMLSLKYDWPTIDDYLIKRPWHQVYKFDMYSIMDSFQKRGIFNVKVIEETFLPLFKGKDVSIDITMKEFYEMSGIELHIITTETNEFVKVDISHKTHPDWRVVDAVYCSSALPVIMAPFLKDGLCYCDGGALCNYPIQLCIDDGNNPDEILGVTKTANSALRKITEESTLLDYVMMIMSKSVEKVLSVTKMSLIKHEYCVFSKTMSIYDIYTVANSMDLRSQFIESGVEFAMNATASSD